MFSNYIILAFVGYYIFSSYKFDLRRIDIFIYLEKKIFSDVDKASVQIILNKK